MRIVVGLGNPGSAYASTRHNVGCAVVEELEQRWRIRLHHADRSARIGAGVVDGEPVMLVEPQLYMKRSGPALSAVQPPFTAQALIVVHDDLDLECGRLRVKRGGGTGGHRGLESIVECFGSEFTRVRLGIGRPPQGEEVATYVLSPFGPEEHPIIAAAVQRAADAVSCIVRQGEEAAMNRFNARGSDCLDAAPMGRK